MPPGMAKIEQLGAEEITALLARNRVGRIAFSTHDRVDIEPIHYVFEKGWIYGRTSHGAKLTTLGKNKWVAFEVDEVRSLFDWESVVVHGGVYVLTPDTNADARDDFTHALELLRRLLPATFREDDPAPHRDVVFRISVQESSGRRAVTPR